MQRLLILGVGAIAACGFGSPEASPLPPIVPEVHFVSVATSEAALRPGRYGVEVTAVLRNELATAITELRASLTFREGAADRAADFRWRDADARDGAPDPQPSSIGPGEQATFRFRVDALAHAAGSGPILLNGQATFQLDDAAGSAAPLDPPASLPFEALPAPIVVDLAADEDDADAQLSLREAVKRANANPGFDRIVFDPAVFPPTAPAAVALSNGLGTIAVNGDLVIDGSGAGVVLTVAGGWRSSQHYGLRLQAGTLVVHGLGFRDLGEGYPEEDVSTNNCGTGAKHDGGAIRVDGGTLILDGNRFSDPGVAERNCYAASVRIHGGGGHRILSNTWTAQAMDSIYVNAATREISGNVMDAGSDLAKVDDCIFVESQGNADLWIVGNLCIDQEHTAVSTSGADTGTLYLVHNTFIRNRVDGVRRTGPRRVELHGNAYLSNTRAAIAPDGDGDGLQISHEAELSNGEFCRTCPSALIQTATISSGADLGFANALGTTPSDFTPREASPLVDTGLDLVDRNGKTPGRFNGRGPERGAVELP